QRAVQATVPSSSAASVRWLATAFPVAVAAVVTSCTAANSAAGFQLRKEKDPKGQQGLQGRGKLLSFPTTSGSHTAPTRRGGNRAAGPAPQARGGRWARRASGGDPPAAARGRGAWPARPGRGGRVPPPR